jgi:hypothetical protein
MQFLGRLIGLLLAAPFVALAVVIDAPFRFVMIMRGAWKAQPELSIKQAVVLASQPPKRQTHEGSPARH